MTLLEREHALEALFRWQRRAASQAGCLLFLGGEAGVGKTVFVKQACASLRGDVDILQGACDPLSTPRPLGPLIDMASALGGRLAHLLDDVDLGRRDRIFAALLARLSSDPMLVVFEDAHWADEATLDLLRFLGRRISSTRSLLVVTHRDDELGPQHPLRLVTGDLATSPDVKRLSLAPLSEAAVRRLAEDHGTEIDPGELHRLTGGNPFFVTEVLAAGAHGVPATVRDAVLARVARLSTGARQALETAAVVGSRLDPERLDALLGPLAPALEECLALGIVQRQGARLAFRHDLVRAAVLEVIAPQRRRRLHRSVLDALTKRPARAADLATLAHHADGAEDAEAVLAYAPAAARQAVELKAHREAAAQYARALAYADDLPAREQAELLEAWAYECYLTDRIPEAIEGRTRALEHWRSVGDRLAEGTTLRWLSRLAWFSGSRAEAEAAARAALEVLEALPPGSELAMAYSNVSQLEMLAHEDAEAIRWAGRAIALAERLGDTVTLVHALNNLGTCTLRMGDESGREALERSLRLALEHQLEEHAARAYTNLSALAVGAYELQQADAYLEQGLAYCTDHDLDAWRLYMSGWQALSSFFLGHWERATDLAGALRRHPRVSPISQVQALVVLGRVRARRGDPEVWPALDEALALAARTSELQRLGPVRCARAEAAFLAGEMEKVREEATAAYELAVARDARWLGCEMAYWRWKAGEDQAAPPAAASPFAEQMAGDWRAAATTWQRLGCPYEALRALAESDDEAALKEALAGFEALGARPAVRSTLRRLQALGVKGIPRGPRPSTRAHPANLTPREVEVLGLLAEGLSNREIAGRLQRSTKTIDHHVSAILGKLAVGSRTEAVTEALRQGLLQLGDIERPA